MAKVKWNKKAFSKKISRTFEDVADTEKFQNDVGDFLVKRVKGFGKSGKPLNDSRKFPNLEPSSVKSRKAKAKYNETDRSFRAKKSNLTFSGQLWDSLSFKAKKLSGSRTTLLNWELFFAGNRKGYRKKDGSRSSAPTNEKLIDILANQGVGKKKKKFKPFTKLDDKGRDRIINLFRRELRRKLRKL